jgi:hypothetical protein
MAFVDPEPTHSNHSRSLTVISWFFRVLQLICPLA